MGCRKEKGKSREVSITMPIFNSPVLPAFSLHGMPSRQKIVAGVCCIVKFFIFFIILSSPIQTVAGTNHQSRLYLNEANLSIGDDTDIFYEAVDSSGNKVNSLVTDQLELSFLPHYSVNKKPSFDINSTFRVSGFTSLGNGIYRAKLHILNNTPIGRYDIKLIYGKQDVSFTHITIKPINFNAIIMVADPDIRAGYSTNVTVKIIGLNNYFLHDLNKGKLSLYLCTMKFPCYQHRLSHQRSAEISTPHLNSTEAVYTSIITGIKAGGPWLVGGTYTFQPGKKLHIVNNLPSIRIKSGDLSSEFSVFESNSIKTVNGGYITLNLYPKDAFSNSVKLDDYVYGLYFLTTDTVHSGLDIGDIYQTSENGQYRYSANLTGNYKGNYYIDAEFYHQPLGKPLKISAIGEPKFYGVIVNGHFFDKDAGFPTTGFTGASFIIKMSPGQDVSNFYWSSNREWVTVRQGNVNFASEGDASEVTITATNKKDINYKLTYSFNISKWFYFSEKGQPNDNLCSSGKHLASFSDVIKKMKPRSIQANREIGTFWGEWGNVHSIDKSWPASAYWLKEKGGIRSWWVMDMSSGSTLGYYLDLHNAPGLCMRKLK
jgi:hypothetical protein